MAWPPLIFVNAMSAQLSSLMPPPPAGKKGRDTFFVYRVQGIINSSAIKALSRLPAVGHTLRERGGYVERKSVIKHVK